MRARRCHIHLRLCTTGMAHPKATYPRITAEIFDEQNFSTFSIRICGPCVGVLFGAIVTWQMALVIWNWRTGEQKMVRISHCAEC